MAVQYRYSRLDTVTQVQESKARFDCNLQVPRIDCEHVRTASASPKHEKPQEFARVY